MQAEGSGASRPRRKGDEAPPQAVSAGAAASLGNARALLTGIVLCLALAVLSTVLALRQAPHPDMLRPIANWDIGQPGWWAYPLERNAFKRNLVRGNLRDVYRLPGSDALWAVGEAGLILHSDDGGASWEQQHPAPMPTRSTAFALIGSAYAADAGDAKALEAQRLAEKEAAARAAAAKPPVQQVQQPQRSPGAQQQVQQSGFGAAPLLPTGEQAGPQPGGAGAGTVQGGSASSASAYAPATRADARRADLLAVYFIDRQNGWAAGRAGALLRTQDGGASWQAADAGSNEDFGAVIFSADGQRGWLLPAEGSRARGRLTSDGGASWRAAGSLADLGLLDARPALGSERNSLAVRGAMPGLIRGRGQEFWQIELVGLTGSRLVRERGPQREREELARWNHRALALQVSADGQRIVVSGVNGRLHTSADGGESWEERRPTSTDLPGLACDDALDDCLAVGDAGTLLRGRGLTDWRRVSPGAAANLLWARFTEGGLRGDAIASANLQLTTTDGGASWQAQPAVSLPVSATRDVFRFDNDRVMWRTGPLGRAEVSRDGGQAWTRSETGTEAWLTSVYFHADGLRGWIAGSDGVLVTRDGGASWQRQGVPVKSWLWHISMEADGRTGRALGAYGTVLTTKDGGAHWEETAHYARYPAPWLWLLLALCTAALALLLPRWLRAQRAQPQAGLTEGAAVTFDADQPVMHLSQDRLGYRPAIEAMAGFLSNVATEPRITLAITGEWGSGKSSMMRMLQSEMAARGYRTAWFNAWHHQQEGRQLTALFNAVRRQAVPSFFRQPLAALRVRSRLIWGRSAFYKLVCIAVPVCVLVALGDFSRQPDALERLKWWGAHQILQWDRVILTDKSIEKLKPVTVTPAKAPGAPGAGAAPAASSEPLAAQARTAVRAEVLDFLKNALVWELERKPGAAPRCTDQRRVADAERCVFKSPAQLLVTIESRLGPLWPSEREAIAQAAESIPLLPLFPALEQFMAPLAGLFILLFTRGMTVYGLQILGPLQNLLGARSSDGGKEATGSVEHYRREFCLLSEALDGRLLIFIDDIDRCTPETVGGIMELTNYLVDVGRCFVVLGMAMERVKATLPVPKGNNEADYADKYLRKLVHIELPVPIASAQESLRLFLQRAAPAAGSGTPALSRDAWRALWDRLRPRLTRALLIGAAVLGLAAAYQGGALLNRYRHPPPLPIAAAQPPSATPAPAASPAASPLPGALEREAALARTTDAAGGEVGLVASPATQLPLHWLLGLAAAMLGALAWSSSRALRERVLLALGGVLRTRDSEDFARALQIWLDVVRRHDNTPRGIKRFCNRARLLALYEQRDVASLQAEGEQGLAPIPDVHIVALAAIHHVSPERLQMLSAGHDATDWHAHFSEGDPVGAQIRAHEATFGWPDLNAIARFIERVERIAVR